MSASLINFPKRQNFQEFKHNAPTEVVAASDANINIATLANGSVVDQYTVSTNDLVLLKDQSTASENGVYIVGASAGTTVRAAGFDTAAELNRAVVQAGEGKVINTASSNRRKFYYQTATIVNLGVDTVTWGSTPATFVFTVPGGVNYITALIVSAGGAGGASASTGSSNSGGTHGSNGGGGGAGGAVVELVIPVTPGDTLDIDVAGYSRNGVMNSYNSGTNGASSSNMVAAADGAPTTIVGTGVNIYVPGGDAGASTNNPGNGVFTTQAGGTNYAGGLLCTKSNAPGGASGGSSGDSGENATTITPYSGNTLATGGSAGANHSGGGAGGNGIGVGGSATPAGTGTAAPAFNTASNAQGYGAGGAGAPSAECLVTTNVSARKGSDGGYGYAGYVLLTW